ncbi:MAG: LamG domain-containing protein [Candidatus Aenigmatarchaeota archaeon]
MIAVVLLIAFTIGVGGLVSLFLTGVTTRSISGTKYQSENFTQCAFGLLEIKKVECSASRDGLVGYWKFDSVNSTNYTKDVSDYKNDGKLIGYSCNPATCNLTDGKFGKALSFDGINDYVRLPDLSSFGGIVTLCAWFNADTLSNSGIVSYLGRDANPWIAAYLKVMTNGLNYALGFADGNLTGNVLVQAIEIKKWYHACLVYDGSVAKVYVNGSLVRSDTYNKPLSIVSTPSFISRDRPSGTEYFNGTIDEVRIYNRALSEDEIKRDYANGVALRVLLANNGRVNLGKNFTLSYVVGDIGNTTQAGLNSDLTPGGVNWLTLPNITDSGALSRVRTAPITCSNIVATKEITEWVC